jgi:hypothetical protein
MLLASHPQVCTVGELNLSGVDDPRTYRCSCGVLLRACAFWKAITARMESRGIAFDVLESGTDFAGVPSRIVRRALRPLHRGRIAEAARDLALAMSPSWRRHYPVQQARNATLVECLAEETGASVIVDSSKTGIRLKFLLRNPSLDVRVIRLIRDGRAVALTYTNPAEFADARDPKLRGGGMGGNRDDERLPIAKAAREWRRSHEEADAIVRRLGAERWTRVHYEALCERTDQTLEALYRFLAVDPVCARPDFRSVAHHVIGNGMRLDNSNAVSVDQRWTRALSEHDHRTFDAVAGSLNRSYGYAG